MIARHPIQNLSVDRFSFGRNDALAIISLFAIGVLVYGLYIPFLGFYWDDWPVVWVYNALGPQGVGLYFAGQRPAYGWIIAHLASVLGISPMGWQVAALAVRCASSGAVFIAFCAAWPKRKDVAWLTGALVLLYPGFTLQPIALGFIPYQLSFLLFVASMATTIFSITKPLYFWLFLPMALVMEGFSYVIIEYFVGLELLRLLVLVALKNRVGITGDLRRTLGTALIAWSPYATVWMAYILWRAFVFRVVSYYATGGYMDVGSGVSRILRSPVHEAWARVLGGIRNVLMATVVACARPFSSDLITFTRSGILSWAIAIIVVGITIYTLRRMTVSIQAVPASEFLPDEPRRFPENGLLLGIVGLGVAGLTLAVSNLHAEFPGRPSFADRFTLPFMLPASLTLSCLLLFPGPKRLSRTLLVSLILFAFSAFPGTKRKFLPPGLACTEITILAVGLACSRSQKRHQYFRGRLARIIGSKPQRRCFKLAL